MKWHRDKWGHIIDENGKEVRFRSVSILSSSSDERLDQAERNTDLICASPALLEALEKSRRFVDCYVGEDIVAGRLILEIDAAIAAAKGEV